MPSGSKAELRLCSVSVDLDEIPCYAAIHGLPEPSEPSASAIYRCALPRLAAEFEALQIPATFFAIGKDLRHAHARQALARLAAQGHEIANHSLDHLYDLSRRSRAEMRTQVAGGIEAIERAVGRAPVGFRAPGYTINDTLFSVLSELGVAYDSSVFPCPLYYSLKLAAISGYRLLSRPTHSILDHPRVLSAPADPYRIGAPYTRRGSALLELPIGVTRASSGQLPYIGTFLSMAGERGARWFSARIAGRSHVNLELHGIDASDAELDGLHELRQHQPDLRRSAAEKLAALRAAITYLREQGYRFVTLAEAARVFGAD
jgi:peptidoglycan/xylan/chitin deacetylase (PgdA/CDA1 family)